MTTDTQQFILPRRESVQSIPTEKIDGHYYWLDLIRFLAAFAVMASHFRGAFFEEYGQLPESEQNIFTAVFYSVTRLGFEAVLVFFVLSGMLVGGKTITRIKNSTFNRRDYIIDRTVRIMLPLIASLLLYFPISIECHIYLPLWNWICSIFSLQGIFAPPVFDTLWSLSYEVWFYIVIFGIACLFMTGKQISSGVRYSGIAILTLSMLVFTKLRIDYLFIWFLGAIVFYLKMSARKIVLWMSFFISVFLLLILQFTSGSHFIGSGQSENPMQRMILVICFGLTFSIFLQQIIYRKPQSAFGVCINRIGTRMAAFSYTLYLTHIPVMRLIQHLGAPKSEFINVGSILLYCLWIIIALAVAFALYWTFERNTNVVKKYIKNKLDGKFFKTQKKVALD